jgi:hypothetical protein
MVTKGGMKRVQVLKTIAPPSVCQYAKTPSPNTTAQTATVDQRMGPFTFKSFETAHSDRRSESKNESEKKRREREK